MLSCNIGPKNRLMRGGLGLIVNFLTIFFAASLPIWAFWLGIILSYAIVFQGIVGWCYMHALLGSKDMK
jgi:hypothetical protein